MVVHDTPHKPTRPQLSAACALQPAARVKHFFNNSSLWTFSPCCSITFLPNVVTESLNTSVRVCFAQPSHSGAECDPRGAVFAWESIHPNLPPFTCFPLEVIDTPFESTAALAAGPKHGSFLSPTSFRITHLTAKYSHACAAKYSQAG